MNSDAYFNFSFDNWSLLFLSLFPVFVNVGIFIYVLFFVTRTTLSSVFLIFLFTLIMWRLQEVILHLSVTQETAQMWYRMFAMSTNFIGVTGLHFVLVLINKGKWNAKNYHFVALYLPTFLFSMFFLSNVDYMTFENTEKWGWVYTPSHPTSITAFVLIGLHASLMLFLLARYAYRIRLSNSNEYKRARIILIGSVVPIIVGCAYQIVLPVFFHFKPIPIASSFVIFFSISILIAITKYNFFEYSPIYQWEEIVQQMNQGILIVDNEEFIRYVNDKLCTMFGYNSNDLINKQVNEYFVLTKDKKEKNRIIKKRQELFKDKYQIILKKRNGADMICEINAQPYLDMDKKIIGSTIVLTDVTAQKEAERKIKDSENRYRSFVENATDAIFIATPSSTYIDVNKRACQLLGYSREELLKLSSKDILFEEDISMSPMAVADLIKDKILLTVRTLKHKDGKGIPTEISSRLLPDGNIISIVRDITERKKTEEELMQKIREMDAFIYRASHDLRGPLASISGLAMIGKNELNNELADFYFNKIHDSINRLDSIIQELSDIARVTQAQLSPSEINLQKEVEDILESLNSLPNFSNINFIKQVTIPTFLCDKILLIIILQNLIINSINYSDASKEHQFIKISAKEYEKDIMIIVEDNGIGMAVDIQHRVFDMFYRGTTVSKGSGLGMYIVKNAVKKLKGVISLKSEEGVGTAVSIQLPKID
jgi:PAS domain S-box-containing protein